MCRKKNIYTDNFENQLNDKIRYLTYFFQKDRRHEFFGLPKTARRS